jgi:hypothetical protein
VSDRIAKFGQAALLFSDGALVDEQKIVDIAARPLVTPVVRRVRSVSVVLMDSGVEPGYRLHFAIEQKEREIPPRAQHREYSSQSSRSMALFYLNQEHRVISINDLQRTFDDLFLVTLHVYFYKPHRTGRQ